MVIKLVMIKFVDVCKLVVIIGVFFNVELFLDMVELFLRVIFVFICCNLGICIKWFLKIVFVIIFVFLVI